jgi:hypothetical protein
MRARWLGEISPPRGAFCAPSASAPSGLPAAGSTSNGVAAPSRFGSSPGQNAASPPRPRRPKASHGPRRFGGGASGSGPGRRAGASGGGKRPPGGTSGSPPGIRMTGGSRGGGGIIPPPGDGISPVAAGPSLSRICCWTAVGRFWKSGDCTNARSESTPPPLGIMPPPGTARAGLAICSSQPAMREFCS